MPVGTVRLRPLLDGMAKILLLSRANILSMMTSSSLPENMNGFREQLTPHRSQQSTIQFLHGQSPMVTEGLFQQLRSSSCILLQLVRSVAAVCCLLLSQPCGVDPS